MMRIFGKVAQQRKRFLSKLRSVMCCDDIGHQLWRQPHDPVRLRAYYIVATLLLVASLYPMVADLAAI
jgi:hypothetical protein